MRNAYASHTDFGFLRGVILENPKAMPSNIDMVFERRGNFLIGEWKRENEADIPPELEAQLQRFDDE